MHSEISQTFGNSTIASILNYHFGWEGISKRKENGKRLRPILLFLCLEACGGNWRNGIPAACAVEFLHNYSLIHDDIEDRDEIRHGRSAVWKKFGMPAAINAGDALYGLAFSQMKSFPRSVSLKVVRSVYSKFSNAASQLTIGQAADLNFETREKISLAEYWQMVEGKTATLMQTSTAIGSILGRADAKTINAFSNFGLYLGMAFQARDDFLGIWGDSVKIGKPAGSDLIRKKKSLPICFGLENDIAFWKLYTKGDNSSSNLKKESILLSSDGALDFTIGEINANISRARDHLEKTRIRNELMEQLTDLLDSLNIENTFKKG
jgi:geranylgeranyl diphosphate synthase type I